MLKYIIRTTTVHVQFVSTTHTNYLRNKLKFQAPLSDYHRELIVEPQGVLETGIGEMTMDDLKYDTLTHAYYLIFNRDIPVQAQSYIIHFIS